MPVWRQYQHDDEDDAGRAPRCSTQPIPRRSVKGGVGILNKHQLQKVLGTIDYVRSSSEGARTGFEVSEGAGDAGGLTGPRLGRAQATFRKLYPDGVVYCPYCGQPAELLDGATVDRLFVRSKRRSDSMVWACVLCDACVGCHGGSDMPLGTLADRATRVARVRAHKAFDSLWSPGAAPDGRPPPMTRGGAYDWMAMTLGIDPCLAHIAALDRYQCDDLCDSASELWSMAGGGGGGGGVEEAPIHSG